MADEFDEVVEGDSEEVLAYPGARDPGNVPEELPAIGEARPLKRPSAPAVPAVHAAALAATGFVAGAAAAAIVRRRSSRRLGRANARAGVRRSVERLPI